MNEKLKPCPFCGGDVPLMESENSTKLRQRWIIECYNCGLTMFDLRKDLVIKSWNTRK